MFTYKRFFYIKTIDLFEFQYYEYFTKSFLDLRKRKMVITVVGPLNP